MTPERLAELKALAEKATRGPWSVSWLRGALRQICRNVDPDCFWCPDDGEDTASALTPDKHDAEFIAASRVAVPELIAEVERLRNQTDNVERIAAWLEKIDEYGFKQLAESVRREDWRK